MRQASQTIASAFTSCSSAASAIAIKAKAASAAKARGKSKGKGASKGATIIDGDDDFDFVEEAKASGLVAKFIEQHKVRGLSVAPSAKG